MGFYDELILPHLIDCACSMDRVMELRRQVVPECRGVVLEVGIGSGTNLPLYDPDRVELVYGLEPSEGMRRKARANLTNSPVTVRWLDLPGEDIPLQDSSVDTVLLTFTLCTIPDCQAALKHMARVLRPDGQLLFLEHGQSRDPGVRKWQDRITPAWKKIAGGCHLNRPIDELIEQAGLRIEKLDTFYLPKTPKFAAFLFSGRAIKA
jgi:ubiquinone/menaquinone biosynthesis C-methylase UbiE